MPDPAVPQVSDTQLPLDQLIQRAAPQSLLPTGGSAWLPSNAPLNLNLGTSPALGVGSARPPGSASDTQPNPQMPWAQAAPIIQKYESPEGNRPNYRFDPGHTASGDWQITDTNWRKYAPGLGIDLNQYPNALSAPKDVQYQVAGKMYATEGWAPWAKFNSRLAQSIGWSGPQASYGDMLDQASAAGQKAHEEHERLAQQEIDALHDLQKQVSALAPDSTERHKLVQQQIERSQALQDRLLDMAKNPPHQKPTDFMSTFGSLAMLVAAIGGSRSRQPATASLNAAAGVIDGVNSNNKEEFERNLKVWQAQTGVLKDVLGFQNDTFREIMENDRLDETQRLEKINEAFHFFDMAHGIRAMEVGNFDEVFKTITTLANAKAKLDESAAKTAESYARGRYYESQAGGGVTGKSDLAQQTRTLLELRAQELGLTYDDLVANHPDEVAATRQKAAQQLSEARGKGTSGGELTDEAADLIAEQYIRGDQNAITSQPRSGPIRRQIENKIAEKVRGLDDASGQIMMNRMRMAEARSAATTAGRVTMNTELYAREAAGAGQQVIDTSKKFSRTNYPLVNQALAAYETHTGDPDIIAFGTAINSLMNAYGKLSNPTGTGIHDADKDQLRKILDRSLSQGQIEAGVAQIVKEGRVVATAAEQTQRDVLATIVPGKGTRKGAVPVPPENMGDPDGTSYGGSDGNTYVKHGGQMVPQ